MKAGIITLYYNNDNYGGIAQAYALQHYLESIGVDAELISYQKNRAIPKKDLSGGKEKGLTAFITSYTDGFFKRLKRKVLRKISPYLCNADVPKNIEIRKKAFERSRNVIKHSCVYNSENIVDCVDSYDVFISGSDQIWKPDVVDDAYVFNFLPQDKKVISYASSIATSIFSEDYDTFMKNSLQKYSWISVREFTAQEYLCGLLGREVDVVVDPTLLLDRSEWNNLASDSIVEQPYVLAYFLGESPKQRKKTIRIARERGLTVVSLPHVEGRARVCDAKFGDIQLYDVDLPSFLSLIKNAELVCTDSFHAIIFSYVFEKDFWAFERESTSKKRKTSSRTETLLSLLELENRMLSNNEKIPSEKFTIDYTRDFHKLNETIQESKKQLSSALGLS
ncbi:MAG: polysaccharide pyruvyl transferase family protein [Ruminococcus sp.]|nr:polysaccharide pyruvyl transferase family protein [Ruminococcus sp.]